MHSIRCRGDSTAPTTLGQTAADPCSGQRNNDKKDWVPERPEVHPARNDRTGGARGDPDESDHERMGQRPVGSQLCGQITARNGKYRPVCRRDQKQPGVVEPFRRRREESNRFEQDVHPCMTRDDEDQPGEDRTYTFKQFHLVSPLAGFARIARAGYRPFADRLPSYPIAQEREAAAVESSFSRFSSRS